MKKASTTGNGRSLRPRGSTRRRGPGTRARAPTRDGSDSTSGPRDVTLRRYGPSERAGRHAARTSNDGSARAASTRTFAAKGRPSLAGPDAADASSSSKKP